MHVLVTGAGGFIASHLVEHVRITRPDWRISIIDRLNYAGSLDRLARWRADDKVQFLFHDFRAALSSYLLAKLGKVNVIIHAGAETHVDNSLQSPQVFVESNVLGTFHMLEACRELKAEKFVFVSTDEVFGAAPTGINYVETDKYNPSNPYSATKAGAECLCLAWQHSLGVPLLITRTMNNFGERQHPEKFVPKAIKASLRGEPLPIHMQKKGNNISFSSRYWLHARNHADAILFLVEQGQSGMFHIAGVEKDVLEMAEFIGGEKGTGRGMKTQHVDVHSTRPGHDLRYALDDSKLRKLGWNPPLDFEDSLSKTIKWTLENKVWLG